LLYGLLRRLQLPGNRLLSGIELRRGIPAKCKTTYGNQA
jgi:hypothetical protein